MPVPTNITVRLLINLFVPFSYQSTPSVFNNSKRTFYLNAATKNPEYKEHHDSPLVSEYVLFVPIERPFVIPEVEWRSTVGANVRHSAFRKGLFNTFRHLWLWAQVFRLSTHPAPKLKANILATAK